MSTKQGYAPRPSEMMYPFEQLPKLKLIFVTQGRFILATLLRLVVVEDRWKREIKRLSADLSFSVAPV